MAEASLSAMVADLLGEAPEGTSSERLDLGAALRMCRPGEIYPARDGARKLAVAVLADGSSVVVDDSCPHDGGLISDGFVEGQSIICARHGWEFDGKTGRCPHRRDVGLILSREPGSEDS